MLIKMQVNRRAAYVCMHGTDRQLRSMKACRSASYIRPLFSGEIIYANSFASYWHFRDRDFTHVPFKSIWQFHLWYRTIHTLFVSNTMLVQGSISIYWPTQTDARSVSRRWLAPNENWEILLYMYVFVCYKRYTNIILYERTVCNTWKFLSCGLVVLMF